MLHAVEHAVSAGVDLIQVREKHLTARQLCDLVAEVLGRTAGSETRVLVNDRADIAAAVGADGVHLTSTSMPPDAVRRAFGGGIIIGVSAHTSEELRIAAGCGADFAVFGPVFDKPGKAAGTGLDALEKACAEAGQMPVIGLGGINGENFASVTAAGAAGVAGIRAFHDPGFLQLAAGKLI